MRFPREAAAAIVSVSVVGLVAAVTVHDPFPQHTTQVTQQSQRPSRAQPGSRPQFEDPARGKQAARISDVGLEPIAAPFVYSEDYFLPRPVGEEAYYSEDPNLVKVEGDGVFAMPVSGRPTSPFGMRLHPILGVYKLHTGQDFAAPCGTPVGAAESGVVTFVGWAGGNGYMVSVAHGSHKGFRNVVTNYGHLSTSAVKVGDKVSRHQAIGRVGNTGYSTGCHLHFEVKADDKWTDPMSWLTKDAPIVVTDGMKDFTPSPRPSGSPSQTAPPAASPPPGLPAGPPPPPAPPAGPAKPAPEAPGPPKTSNPPAPDSPKPPAPKPSSPSAPEPEPPKASEPKPEPPKSSKPAPESPSTEPPAQPSPKESSARVPSPEDPPSASGDE